MAASWLRRLSKMKILGASLIGAAVIFVSGIIAWGGFNTVMEATNTMDFCIGCHEMQDNVYQEYKKTVHFQNRSGVRASCSDCHVPDPWVHKFVRKIKASGELYHWALGSVDTKEKFEAKRLTLAKHVWKAMKETDSRECRNCHTWEAMTDTKQKRRAWKQHQLAQDDNMTCIDCHRGIAHRPVHELLEDDEDFYDGKPDPRALPVLVAEAEGAAATDAVTEQQPEEAAADAASEEAASAEVPAEAAPEEAAAGDSGAEGSGAGETQVAAAAAGGGDWGGIEGRKVTLFYPGQTSVEWVLKGSDHGGARAVTKIGDRCGECHEGEQADMGKKLVTGEKAETMVIPDKRAAIEADVKAAHDGQNLYLQVSWPDAPHTPAPFVDGGKMDPDNQVKLAVMLIPEENEFATQVGCWATCHHDSRYMPDHPSAEALGAAGDLATRLEASDGITKYLQETRSDIEIKGKDGAPRGGWDKLLEQGEIDAAMGGNLFLDLVRFKSGSGEIENGYVLERRVAQGSSAVNGQGQLVDGIWTVDLQIPMSGGGNGDLALDPGRSYTVGFAIHDDFTLARFHHVSLEYRLGFDSAEAEINAAKR